MADTIVNTPERTVSNDSAAGWAVAIVIILAVVIGGIYYFRAAPASPGNPAASVQVNIPNTGGTGTTGTGNAGSSGGSTTGGSSGGTTGGGTGSVGY